MVGARLGIISDTHGLLRPEAVKVLTDSDLILHAGDIGRPEVIKALTAISPVVAIRGNVDRGEWAQGIPERQVINIEDVSIYMLHDVKELDEAEVAGVQVIISGHSHKPVVEERKGLLFVNPGSAGPRRFKLPISVARLSVKGKNVKAEIIEVS